MGIRIPADQWAVTGKMDKLARKSIFSRFASRAAFIALTAILLLYALTYGVTQTTITAALKSSVDTDIAGLADIYASGGEAELLARLKDRQAMVSSEGRRAHYSLAKKGDPILSGAIGKWPNLDPALSEHGYVNLANGTQVYARATRLSNDLSLLVAREYNGESQLLLRLTFIFLIAAILIPAAVWLVGRRAAAGLNRRVTAINRLLSSSTQSAEPLADIHIDIDDEVGLLARNSAELVTRYAAAAQAQRYVTDQVAHEIRTPLLHLDTRLRKMQEQPGDQFVFDGLKDGREDIRRITGLLDSLLDIAASEARRGDMSGLKVINLSELLNNIADLYEASIEEAGMMLSTDIAPNVTLAAEEMQIGRLISNLIDNAIKYAGSGTTLSISLAPGPYLTIGDNGPGIDPAIRDGIFERFRRGPNSAANGHGLGLALAKAICERHGLNIYLQNNVNGCSFVIAAKGADDAI
ncbi:sensor histidine kinase [Sphingorhabdus arenilitoris]|uniref:histidine kinase n=1 Tax=Sphingorhabdus arenilitoris TaxID=1490041 RepID=A0ABV8RGK1_9SPHN